MCAALFRSMFCRSNIVPKQICLLVWLLLVCSYRLFLLVFTCFFRFSRPLPRRRYICRLRTKGAGIGAYLCIMAISVYRRAVRSKNSCLISSHCSSQKSFIRLVILSIFPAISFVGCSGLRQRSTDSTAACTSFVTRLLARYARVSIITAQTTLCGNIIVTPSEFITLQMASPINSTASGKVELLHTAPPGLVFNSVVVSLLAMLVQSLSLCNESDVPRYRNNQIGKQSFLLPFRDILQ